MHMISTIEGNTLKHGVNSPRKALGEFGNQYQD